MEDRQDNIISLRPNRSLLLRYLETHVDQAHQAQEELAVLVIQVQRRAEIVALYSSRSIESLLEQLALRLAGICRRQDRIVRIADFEYAMYLPTILNDGHALLAANKIMLALAQPFTVEDRAFLAEVKIGIALFPDDAARPDNLLQYAESALEEARIGKLPYALYSGPRLDRLEEKWDMEGALESALHDGEFEVHYQPKINLHDRSLAGAEALVRWRHPGRGLVSPAAFVPVAARSGKLRPLTWSVLNMTLQHAAAWQKTQPGLSVAVNIDPSLLDNDLVARVSDSLALWGLPPGCLTLEITESGVMSQPDVGFAALKRLRDRGVRICIDDFGTGYSSLTNFRHIPAGELKIDRSFVVRLITDPFDMRIVRSVVALARTFELQVSAAGAESFSILGRLGVLGCDFAQGYCVSPPLPVEGFLALAEDYQPLVF